MNKKVVLIDFYSEGSLGLRYIQNALEHSGYSVKIVFLKKYDNMLPEKVTEAEHNILKEFVSSEKPMLVCISLITSFYLELVEVVTNNIKELNIPIVGGGIFATLSPDVCIKYADYIVRGEGEDAVCELADAIANETPVSGIQNLVYKDNDGNVCINEMRPLLTDIDKYGFPRVDTGCEYLINNDKLIPGEPLKDKFAFTVIGTRGCMFSCSFCGSSNLKRLAAGLGSFVRKRSVKSVIDELIYVKSKLKNLVYVRFADGIFPYDKEWVGEFAKEYKAKINLPFKIWTHPLRTDPDTINTLLKIGLHKVIMGIQSGSPYIRNEIFGRKESNESIISASEVYYNCKVPQVEYDLILCHPFETVETLEETFELCQSLHGTFMLNINGLKFMPETPIVDIAVKHGKATLEEITESIYQPIENQFEFLRLVDKSRNNSPEINFWFMLIYITQFRFMRKKAKKIANNPARYTNRLKRLYFVSRNLRRLNRYKHLGVMLIQGIIGKRRVKLKAAQKKILIKLDTF